MAGPKCYVSSISAVRTASAVPLQIEIATSTVTALARTGVEAEQAAIVKALAKWPEADGWTGHCAKATGLGRELLARMLKAVSAAPPKARPARPPKLARKAPKGGKAKRKNRES
jgi:hypothetical protein